MILNVNKTSVTSTIEYDSSKRKEEEPTKMNLKNHIIEINPETNVNDTITNNDKYINDNLIVEYDINNNVLNVDSEEENIKMNIYYIYKGNS